MLISELLNNNVVTNNSITEDTNEHRVQYEALDISILHASDLLVRVCAHCSLCCGCDFMANGKVKETCPLIKHAFLNVKIVALTKSLVFAHMHI